MAKKKAAARKKAEEGKEDGYADPEYLAARRAQAAAEAAGEQEDQDEFEQRQSVSYVGKRDGSDFAVEK